MNSGGVLCVSHGIVVKKVTADGFIVVSAQPALVGDVVTIAFADTADLPTARVRVTAIRPVVRDGVVTHELQLARVDADGESETR